MCSGKQIIKRIFLVLLLGAVAYVALIVWQGSQAKSAIKSTNSPLGQLVDVGGFNMHLHCTGTGSPTVVLEAGAGDFSVIWEKIQGNLSHHTRVCSYDRSGLGWSEVNPDEEPVLSMKVRSQELDRLLAKAEIAPPYIIAGHSFGGLLAKHYANTYADKVAGLVMIDALQENQDQVLSELQQKMREEAASEYLVISALQKIGLLALAPEETPNPGLSAEYLEKYRGVFATMPQVESMILELNSIQSNLQEVKEQALSYDDLPVAVIYSTKQYYAGFSAEENTVFAQQWRLSQENIGLTSSNANTIIDEKSGHYIHLDNPTIVTSTIRDMLERAL